MEMMDDEGTEDYRERLDPEFCGLNTICDKDDLMKVDPSMKKNTKKKEGGK